MPYSDNDFPLCNSATKHITGSFVSFKTAFVQRHRVYSFSTPVNHRFQNFLCNLNVTHAHTNAWMLVNMHVCIFIIALFIIKLVVNFTPEKWPEYSLDHGVTI